METVRGKLCKERKVKANRIRFLNKNCEKETRTESNSISIYDDSENMRKNKTIGNNKVEVVVGDGDVEVGDADIEVEVDEIDLCDIENTVGIDKCSDNLVLKKKETRRKERKEEMQNEIIIEKEEEEDEEEVLDNSPFPVVKKQNNEYRNDNNNNTDINNDYNNNKNNLNIISYLKQVKRQFF